MSFGSNVCRHDLVLNHRRLVKWGISVFPLMFIAVMVWLKWKAPDDYWRWICKEDSLVENLTAIFYFSSGLIAGVIAAVHRRNHLTLFAWMYAILAAGLLFIAIEEISWGQRMIGLKTPAILSRYSHQNEINLHNTKWFPLHLSYIVVGLYGGLSRLLLPRRVKATHREIVDRLVPDYYISPYFLVVALLYLYYDYFSPWLVSLFGDQAGWGTGRFMIAKDQEPAEFLLSVGFLLFVLINRHRQHRGQKDALGSEGRGALQVRTAG